MVLKGYPRISETFISNEILHLESLGFRIHIISMRHPREAFCHASIKKIKAGVDYLPSTIMLHLPTLVYHNLMLAIKKPGTYFHAIQKAATRWLRTRKSATLKHLLQAGYLVHKLLPPKKDIVHFHAHFAHSPTSVAMFSSILSGIPFSFFAHAKDIYTTDKRQLTEKINMAKFAVTCTQYNKKYLSSLNRQGATPLFCVYHGINLSYFSNHRKQNDPTPPYHILTVARMTEKKGLDTIYRALSSLKKQGIEFFHTLIGEGDDHSKIVDLINSLNLEDVTILRGAMTHEEVIDYYAKADLFVLGCRIAANGDRDGIPNVMAESMAMNLPVVATHVSGLPEFLENRVTGLAVDPDNPRKLADAMITLLTDSDLRSRVSTEARKRIVRDFNNKKLIPVLAKFYARQIPALGIDPEKIEKKVTKDN